MIICQSFLKNISGTFSVDHGVYHIRVCTHGSHLLGADNLCVTALSPSL